MLPLLPLLLLLLRILLLTALLFLSLSLSSSSLLSKVRSLCYQFYKIILFARSLKFAPNLAARSRLSRSCCFQLEAREFTSTPIAPDFLRMLPSRLHPTSQIIINLKLNYFPLFSVWQSKTIFNNILLSEIYKSLSPLVKVVSVCLYVVCMCVEYYHDTREKRNQSQQIVRL